MGEVQTRLTVYFEEPFWIGIFERYENKKLSASKVTFGEEPKDYDVYEFVLNHYYSLQFSPAVAAVVKETKKNPKRMQRDIKRTLGKTGVGTKSQQAIKLQQEQNKQKRKIKKHEQKAIEEKRMFELKLQKKKEKHRADNVPVCPRYVGNQITNKRRTG